MKIVIAGAAGRMGRTLIEAVQKDSELNLAAAFDVAGSPSIGRDAGELASGSCGVAIGDSARDAICAGTTLIDFTRPEATMAHLALCVAAGANMIIGTTGFSDGQKDGIRAAAGKIGIVFAPNFAVGVNVTFKLAEIAARSLGDAFDVEIVEAHHRFKVDAPSGTALRLGEVVAGALGRDLPAVAVHGREGITGERDRKSIAFHAIRGGDIVGEHTVIFAGEGERVEVAVRSQSRMTYALGALRAAKFLGQRGRGLFSMQDVLGLN